MRIQPDSTITLYSGVDIEAGELQLDFSTKEKQAAYFQSKVLLNVTNCTMNKKNGRIKITAPGGTVSRCNYLSFVNPSYDNIVYYAQIIDYFWINPELTEITYKIDWFQTSMHQLPIHYDSCYIEREHLSQADFALAEANPFNPNILEFRTAESLPVGEDCEKPAYTYGTDNSFDGMFVGEALCAQSGITNENGALFMFSDIGLESIESEDPTAAQILAQTLQYLRNNALYNTGFYILSPATYKYLAAHYPNEVVYDSTPGADCSRWVGSDWGNLMPGTNNVRPPVSYIYFQNGLVSDSDATDTSIYLSDLLDFFTRKGCLNNILGIYNVPRGLAFFCADSSTQTIYVSQNPVTYQGLESKKLQLYPFSYLRLISPSGDVKELKYENFLNIQNGTDTQAKVGLCMDITEKPNLIAAPMDYKISGASPKNPSINMNIREALLMSQFSTLPFSIPAWEIQMAAVANNIVGNNTIDYSYEIQQKQLDSYKQRVGVVSDVIGAAVQGAQGNVFGALSGAINAAFGATQAELTAKRNQNEFAQSEDAYKYLAGKDDDENAVVNNFRHTRPAYCSDEYHQINGDGTLNNNVNSFLDVIYQKVSLNPMIAQKFDEYFKCFGYSSGRYGVPRCLLFSQGDTSTANNPHWSIVDGKQTTYIKTVNAKVRGIPLPAASEISTMLNSGIRMINGDSLLS